MQDVSFWFLVQPMCLPCRREIMSMSKRSQRTWARWTHKRQFLLSRSLSVVVLRFMDIYRSEDVCKKRVSFLCGCHFWNMTGSCEESGRTQTFFARAWCKCIHFFPTGRSFWEGPHPSRGAHPAHGVPFSKFLVCAWCSSTYSQQEEAAEKARVQAKEPEKPTRSFVNVLAKPDAQKICRESKICLGMDLVWHVQLFFLLCRRRFYSRHLFL